MTNIRKTRGEMQKEKREVEIRRLNTLYKTEKRIYLLYPNADFIRFIWKN